MIKYLVSFKHRHPKIWSLVESVNGGLFRLRYGKVEKVVESLLKGYSVAGCVFSAVTEQDLPGLGRFLARQDGDNLKWFNPHDFDETTLKRLFRNPSFLMMKVTEGEGDGIVGYFFLRCFFIGRAFAGLVVDREWQNRGIGSKIWEAEASICNRLRLRMRATISLDNKPSIASCRNGTDVQELDRLGNGYMAVECKTKLYRVI